MTQPFHVEIADFPPSAATAQAFAADPAFGAIASFVGVVRNVNEGRTAEAVTYDVHEELALKSLQELCAEGLRMADGRARIYIAHARGKMKVGEASVVIAVGTPHRRAAFRICEFLIDRLKEKAPIWKKEHYLEGDDAWLPGTRLAQAG